MCGLLGEFTHPLSPEPIFGVLLGLSRHRGPDQQEVWTDGQFCRLGFNRLSILDLSERGKQPVISPSGRYVLVFNGEIYNYKALQRQYGIPDTALRSQADSEVLAHLADRLSAEALAQALNGMFAIALYDRLEATLTLMRDFAGIKPLYYGRSGNTFVFASQFDQVFRHPAFQGKLQVDPAGLFDYTALGYMAPPRTVFRDIRQCLPGQWLRVDAQGRFTEGFFCTWPAERVGEPIKEEAPALQALDTALDQVVRDQLVADVPVGVFLSGGIDSPLVAAYAGKHKPDITAYTIGVENPELDESAQASAYAQAFGLRHKVIPFTTDELLRETERHFAALPEPFGDYSSLPTHLITQIARQENTVMLSGDGGDELFWGYPRFLNTLRHAPWFRYPGPMRRVGAGLLRRSGRYVSHAVSSEASVEDWILGQQCHNKPSDLRTLLPGLHFSPEVQALYKPEQDIHTQESLLQYLRWNEFYGHLQRVLAKVDRISMGNSLEVRVPLLDHRIIDLAWQIDPCLGIRHHEPKYLLKRLLQQKLGHTPVNRSKMGFSVPIRQWLQGPLREDLRSHLLDMPLFGAPYWNTPELESRVCRFLNGDQGSEWGMWILYAMQKWWVRSLEAEKVRR